MIILSGPSSVGKSTLIDRLRQANRLKFVVPSTTRAIRPDEEIPGRDYNFLSVSDFQRNIRSRLFEEWDFALGHYYGFKANPLFGSDEPAITHSLAKMAVRIRDRHPTVSLVFLRPADPEAHIARLVERFQNPEDRRARLQHWNDECAHQALFNHVLTTTEATDAMSGENENVWRSLGVSTAG